MKTTNEFSFVLKPSTILSAGVGVFATHKIAKGVKLTALFPDGFKGHLRKAKNIPERFIAFCIARENDLYEGPERFNKMDIGRYVNHSGTPNIKLKNGVCYALEDIETDEEIFVNYNDLDEPENKKKSYYKKS